MYTDFVSGVAVDKFLARNNSPAARALGIEPLKEETSVNFGGGITFSRNGLSLSADYYHIAIDNRIVLTGDFNNDDDQIGDLLKALNVGSARFFSNAINTSSDGVDLIVSFSNQINDNQRYNVTLAGNWNDMRIDKINTSRKLAGKEDAYLSNREKLFILASAPKIKGNLSFDYRARRWGANLRVNYFDKITLEDYISSIDVYDARTTLDLSLTYDLTPNLRWTVGGVNLLNAYPTAQKDFDSTGAYTAETEGGGLYDAVQMGYNGAFFFTRIGFRF